MRSTEGVVDPELTAAGLLGLIAEPERLRVVAALVLGAQGVEDVRRSSGLDLATVHRVLARLEKGGLVTADKDGLELHAELFKEVARAAAPVREEADHGTTDPRAASVLRAFLREGRLVSIPTTRAKRLVVLDHLARLFEIGSRYPEKEVDATLRAFHPDYAALRRHLVDEALLSRADGVYWRTGGGVDV